MIQTLIKKIIQTRITFILLALALCFRLYDLGRNPVMLNRDEAALAYNGYLLQAANKDEWGVTWPLALESFGDFKLIGYPAILALFFGFFGLSDLVVRLPAALAGIVLTFLAYKIAKKLDFSDQAALLVLVTVGFGGPLFFYARMAYEAIVALAFFVIVLYLCLSNSPLKHGQVITIFVLAILSICTYNTPLVYTFILALLLPLYKNQGRWYKTLLFSLGLLAIVVIFSILLSKLISQKSAITLFSDEKTRAEFIERREQASSFADKLSSTRLVFYGTKVIQNYIGHFSYEFLVSQGGTHPWHSLPGRGHLSGIVYILVIVGLLLLTIEVGSLLIRISSGKRLTPSQKNRVFILMWIIVAPIPAAITVDAPHATRSLLFLFLIHLGVAQTYDVIASVFSGRLKTMTKILVVILILFSMSEYLHYYFFKYPTTQLRNFQVTYKTAITQAMVSYPNQPVAVVDGGGYNYILTAWYLRMKPDYFYSTVIRQLPDRIGFRYGERVGQFHFIARPSDSSQDERVIIEQQERETDSWIIRIK